LGMRNLERVEFVVSIGPPLVRFVWFIWFVSLIWLVRFNQTN
jgi:hypothetical protein